MADEQTQDPVTEPEAAVASEDQNAQFAVQKLYLKDISFEVPNAPGIFQETGQSEINLNMAQRVNDMGEDLFEVLLTVTATATMDDKTAYLAEVAQAGIFKITGLNEQAMHAALNTLCPNTLFPYARATISSLVSDGGFPPLILQPVNWDALYGQRMAQAQEEAQATDSDS